VTPSPAGYTKTPLAQKLGVKAGSTLVLVAAPAHWAVPGLPPDVQVCRRRALRAADRADVVVAFFTEAARLAAAGPSIARELGTDAALWIAWPRRAGGHQSDLTDQLLRDVLLPVGVVDVKVAALDEDWSGLKFVWRRVNRARP
jgi:hypothetical protein